MNQSNQLKAVSPIEGKLGRKIHLKPFGLQWVLYALLTTARTPVKKNPTSTVKN